MTVSTTSAVGVPTPTVVISKCLEFEACRYDGARIPFDLVAELADHVRFVTVCPEVEIGLGVPRDPIRLVRAGASDTETSDAEAGPRLVQPSSGRDLTSAMHRFAGGFLSGLDGVDGFILKSRSPSCGLQGVKRFKSADESAVTEHGPGLFGGHVAEGFPWAAIEEEGRLRNYRIRHHFLTKLFALARLREVAAGGRMRDLVAFQARHKLMLMAYHQTLLRSLGRLVANAEGIAFPELVAAYRDDFGRALERPPRSPSVVNVLEHAWGYVSDSLTPREKELYRRELRRFREGRTPLGGLTTLMYGWAVRFEVEYLLDQTLFQPYPDPLMSVADSGKGRSTRR